MVDALSADRLPDWPVPVWMGALAGLTLGHLLRATRLHAEWHPRTGARWRDCLTLFLMHNAAVAWLPMRSGEAGYPLWLNRRWQVPLSEALPSLLWLRLQDGLVLLVLGGAFVLVRAGWPDAGSAAMLWGGVGGCAALGCLIVREILRRLGARTAGGSGRWRAALAAHRGGGKAWACCLGNWWIKLGCVAWLLVRGSGILSGPAALMGAMAAEVAVVAPWQAPGGFGAWEAGAWAGARLVGGAASPSAGDVLVAALAVHGVMLGWASLLAVVAWVVDRMARGQAR